MRTILIARIREPSTWLGLAMVLGLSLPPEIAQAIGYAAGGLAMLLPEGKGG